MWTLATSTFESGSSFSGTKQKDECENILHWNLYSVWTELLVMDE